MPQTNPPFVPFWQPALARPEIWRSLLGLVLIHVAFLAATFIVILMGGKLLGVTPQSIVEGSTPAKAMIFFTTFLGYHLGLYLVVRFLHKRPYHSLFGPLMRLKWRQFFYGLGAAFALSVLTGVIEATGLIPPPDTDAPEIRQSLPMATWAMLVLPALALIFIQIMAEELVFRGYLLQQLRARFSSIWLWAILPSFLFGILHFDQATYGTNAYFYVLHTTAAGIILALVTLRTGNIAAAAGLHMANNAMLLILGNEGSLDGLSLFLTSPDLTSPYVGLSIFTQTVLMCLAFSAWWVWSRPRANSDKQLQMPSGKTN
ncbi:lysostaphin resistance A-like protein [Aliiroseovarius crassostreae]|uniref:CPBP family intramembrane glutamic endopeptidase n=1 Tax=Aliiroseovarius crassostreae TaxID=154981 RepID=UPI003C7C3A4B